MNNEENNKIPNPGVNFINYTINNKKEYTVLKAIKKIEENYDFIKKNNELKQRIFNIYNRLKEE